VIDRLRKLVRFEGNSGFTDPYREIIEAVPDALVAHVQLSRLLADFGAPGRPGERSSGGGEPFRAGRSVPLGAARGHEGRALAHGLQQRGAEFRAAFSPGAGTYGGSSRAACSRLRNGGGEARPAVDERHFAE